MPVLNSVLLSASILGNALMLLWLKDSGVVVLGCVIATVALIAIVAIVYAWFLVSLWNVEDRIPGNRTRIALVGALVAAAFAVVSLVSSLRDNSKVKA